MPTLNFFVKLTLACLLLALLALPLPAVGAALSAWFVQAAMLCGVFCIPAALRDMVAHLGKTLGFFGLLPK